MKTNHKQEDSVYQIIKKYFPAEIKNISKVENVTNNAVYSFEAAERQYIVKLYKSRYWPEDGKIPFVYRSLSENKIQCPELIAFNRSDENFPNGYLIESKIHGIPADKIALDTEQEAALYARLAELMSSVHRIPIKNFGYIAGGEADYDSMLSFFEDEFDEKVSEIAEANIFSKAEICRMQTLLFDMLCRYNDLPPVLCHGDLSKKNIIVKDSGDIVLIDWDDAMSYNWMADVSRLTFWMKLNYGEQRCGLFRNAFLENYRTEYRRAEFDGFEKAFHIYCAMDSLSYFISMGDTTMAENVKGFIKDIMTETEEEK